MNANAGLRTNDDDNQIIWDGEIGGIRKEALF